MVTYYILFRLEVKIGALFFRLGKIDHYVTFVPNE